MAGQRCSSSEFQGFSVPAAAAAVRAWAASASQQFSVSAFERWCCPGVGACPASASQQFRVSEFQSLSVAAAAAAGRGWAASAWQQFGVSGFERCRCPGVSACPASASQQFRVSELQRLSVAAAAAAGRGWAALQQFSVSAFERCCCCGGGAWLGSVAAVHSFRASAFPLRRPRCVPGQRQRRSTSVFQRLSVAAALLAVPAQRQRRSSSEFQSFSV